ncbi:MAG TPA: insulinase family protein, partial [Planctomycetaceae bacterium]|nr:insulinase family protein [Planctomycetaceae bacterium]
MEPQDIQTYKFENGLTLVVESMPAVRSAAFSLLVPAGSIYDPQGRNGTAAILCELVTRGAGKRDSQELSDALDDLGVQRSE